MSDYKSLSLSLSLYIYIYIDTYIYIYIYRERDRERVREGRETLVIRHGGSLLRNYYKDALLLSSL